VTSRASRPWPSIADRCTSWRRTAACARCPSGWSRRGSGSASSTTTARRRTWPPSRGRSSGETSTISRAFVSGAAGFIGSNLTDALLARGDDVVALDCFTPYYDVAVKVGNADLLRAHPSCTFIQADLRSDDLDALLDGVDVIFHHAAQAGVRASWDHRFGDYATHNVLGTQRLLDAALRAGVRRFVYASSSSIYGNALSHPTMEDALPAPFSPYGVTKLAGEHLVRAYAQNFGLSTISLRYFTVYGPRQRPDMSVHGLVEAALRASTFHLFGDGTQARELTYVGDVVEANLLAATAQVEPGSVCNIAGGAEIALVDLIALVEELVGARIDVVAEDPARGDVQKNSGSTDRARQVLGWSPRTSLRDGIAAQVEWHRSR
jgi:nucleoside-diphosphate-sugar epimerase